MLDSLQNVLKNKDSVVVISFSIIVCLIGVAIGQNLHSDDDEQTSVSEGIKEPSSYDSPMPISESPMDEPDKISENEIPVMEEKMDEVPKELDINPAELNINKVEDGNVENTDSEGKGVTDFFKQPEVNPESFGIESSAPIISEPLASAPSTSEQFQAPQTSIPIPTSAPIQSITSSTSNPTPSSAPSTSNPFASPPSTSNPISNIPSESNPFQQPSITNKPIILEQQGMFDEHGGKNRSKKHRKHRKSKKSRKHRK